MIPFHDENEFRFTVGFGQEILFFKLLNRFLANIAKNHRKEARYH